MAAKVKVLTSDSHVGFEDATKRLQQKLDEFVAETPLDRLEIASNVLSSQEGDNGKRYVHSIVIVYDDKDELF